MVILIDFVILCFELCQPRSAGIVLRCSPLIKPSRLRRVAEVAMAEHLEITRGCSYPCAQLISEIAFTGRH